MDEFSPYMRLELAQARRYYADKTEAQVVDMQHWIAGKKREPAKVESRLDKNRDRLETVEQARERSTEAGKVPDAQKIRNIRENRKNAEELLSFSEDDEASVDSMPESIDDEIDGDMDPFTQEIDELWDED
jgi:hypothetical protein